MHSSLGYDPVSDTLLLGLLDGARYVAGPGDPSSFSSQFLSLSVQKSPAAICSFKPSYAEE